MRRRRSGHGLTVHAIAGTHVVTLGLDLSDAARTGCLGFAIHRTDKTEDEAGWLRGMKTFVGVGPPLGPGGTVSSLVHPFQTFQWADYAAKPDHEYAFRVVPMYGTPGALREGRSVSVTVTTESEEGRKHSAFFNRGSLASQEYARRFQDKAPSELPPEQRAAAYAWLSRGLLAAFERFVARAAGPDDGLYGAVYEFQWPEALQAIRAAKDRGADVRIVYDGIAGDGPRAANETAIAAAGLADVCTPRTTGRIMHNKFLVLTHKGRPVAVWTGSTNLTENGVFGHSNCAHVVEDRDVAARYLAYWTELGGNPTRAAETAWVNEHNPIPPTPWTAPVSTVFSPHNALDALARYADIAAGATGALFMTFAFGMHPSFQQVYDRADGVLRFALMDKAGTNKAGADAVGRIRRRPNVVVAIGNRIETNAFDRWLAEREGIGEHVQWVHTKYLLADPLGPDPVVVTGSANFSDASTDTNNENMVVIRGDKRVADIYLGEFLRMYSHYAFREAVAIAQRTGETSFRPQFLAPNDSWQADYYEPGTQRSLRRAYFAQA